MAKIIEISMAHNMAEDKDLIMAIQKEGFEVSRDFMWIISIKNEEEIEKVRKIFDIYNVNKYKNFIVR